nr:putative reverse transcriptase domain-containing protein [Tanacetum cinerariifolium]
METCSCSSNSGRLISPVGPTKKDMGISGVRFFFFSYLRYFEVDEQIAPKSSPPCALLRFIKEREPCLESEKKGQTIKRIVPRAFVITARKWYQLMSLKIVQYIEGCFGFDLRWVHARLGAVAKARFDTHHLEDGTASAHLVNNSVATKMKHFPLEGVVIFLIKLRAQVLKGSLHRGACLFFSGVWPCPFRGFHCCPDGMAGSKGFPQLVAHIKCLHLSLDDRRGALREALSIDFELFVLDDEALKALDQWWCGVVRDVEDFIVGSVRPQVKREVVPLGGVVVDEVLLDCVLSLPITTVKSIPHSCRMVFSHSSTAALGKVAVTPTSIEAWVKLLLLPRCTLCVFRPSNCQEHRSGNRKSLQCHSIQRALAAWYGDGFIKLIPSLFAQPLRVVSRKDDHVSGSDSSTVGTNVKQCLRNVSDGHFTAGVKVLCSSGVASFGTDTLIALLDKHPILPPLVMPGSLPSEPPLIVDVDSVLRCIQSFPKGTSCGRDGLRAQHILDAFCGEGSEIVIGLLKAISVVVNLLLERSFPKVLAEFVAYAPLTPLLKPDNGIMPIVVDVIWRRLASKVAMRGVRKEMSKYLKDFQFRLDAVYFPMGGFFIWSVGEIKDCCQLLFHAWYLDDGMIIGDTKEVVKAINIIRAEGPRLGLELNIKKTKVFWPSCNGVKVKDGLFPRDIGRPTLGMKLLGGAVIQDTGFISSLALKMASRAVELMSLLPHLQDPQFKFLLLRSCMRVAKLLFGLKTCQPMYIGEAVSIFYNDLRRVIEAIMVCGVLFLWISNGGPHPSGCGIDGANSDYGYALDRRKDDGKLRHVADSPQWRKIDNKFPKFSKEIRNIRFGLSSDGINPFENMSNRYSTWPVLLSNIKSLVSMKDCKLQGMKSHDCHVLMAHMIPIAILGLVVMVHLVSHIGSIVEGCASEEVIDFYTNYLEGVKGIGVPQSRHVGRLHGVDKRHILGVDNVVDKDEYDQFDELPPFSEGISPIDGETTYLRFDHDEGLWVDTPGAKRRKK